MIEIRPMDEGFLLPGCLHGGPIDPAVFEPPPDSDSSGLPPHPWSDDTIRELAPTESPLLCPELKEPIEREFMREMIRRYGTCAILAWDGPHVVGHIRFYPMEVARLLAPGETDPSPILDCTAACEPGEDETTLWVQCVMTCGPYEDAAGATRAGARKGIGLKLAQALIPWARDRGWRRIVKVAHCDLDWFYGIQGGGGKAFWEKAGFRVAGSFHKRAWKFSEDDLPLIQAQMAASNMTWQDTWTWHRMTYEL